MGKGFLGLSFSLAKANFKLRNEGSYLGILWYLVGPLLLFGLLFLIFSGRIGGGIEHYPLYLLLGIIMFNFFQKSTMETTRAIIENRLLLKSVNFSYAALIFSVVLKFLFSHIFEILLFFVFLLIFKVSVMGLVFYPLIAIVFCFFIYGASLFLSALTVYFIDLENIWLFVSTLIWFGTPIFYAIEGQTRLFALNLVNPMYYFITLSREVLIYARMPELWMIFGMLIFTMLSLVVGLAVFGKLKRRFAELI